MFQEFKQKKHKLNTISIQMVELILFDVYISLNKINYFYLVVESLKSIFKKN